MSTKLKNNFKLFLLSLILFISPLLVKGWEMQTDWPDSPGGVELTSESGVAELVAYFYEWGIVIGVIIFFGILIFSGLEYITSAGNPDKLKGARKRMVSGFAGVLLLLGSYLILNAINPDLTEIRMVTFSDQPIGSIEFSTGFDNPERMCEFAFVTVHQEDQHSHPETYFLLPGMSVATADVTPEKSIACRPDIDDQEVLEVRKNDSLEEHFYTLVKRQSGDEIDENNRINVEDFQAEDLRDLYRQRYELIGTVEFQDDDSVFSSHWITSRQYNRFSVFGPDECYNYLISNTAFQNPRCLEVEEDNGQIKITEYRRVGFAPFLPALEHLIDLNNIDLTATDGECPSATVLNDDLGYLKDPTGGGCGIAFYDGQSRRFGFFGRRIPTCEQQISRPSASTGDFTGMVDRESNCMELTRHDPPLDIDTSAHDKYRLVIQAEGVGSGSSMTINVSVDESLEWSFNFKNTSSTVVQEQIEVDPLSNIHLTIAPNTSYRKVESNSRPSSGCTESVTNILSTTGDIDCRFSTDNFDGKTKRMTIEITEENI